MDRGATKSGRSRVVSIDPGAVDVLKGHRKRQAADKLKVGESWKARKTATCSPRDGVNRCPLTGVSSLMAALVKEHNGGEDVEPLPRARLHDLRHVHAATLLLAGVPVHLVAARLGRADPAITLRVYAHVVNEQLAEAAAIFAELVDGAA